MHQQTENMKTSEKLLASLLEFERLGLRVKAKEAAYALIEALPSLNDKDAWTRANLHTLPTNGQSRIRHEIYDGIVFPALRAGYERNDPEAFYLLGKTWQNFISGDVFAKQIGFHSSEFFFERAYQVDPSSERYKRAFLGALIVKFDYLFHEWPSGILINHDNWPAELVELKSNIELASSLDESGQHVEDIREFLEKTNIYSDRLSSHELGH